MIIAHDLFAEKNPAFGTFMIFGFCRNFINKSETAPHIALIYLALPISLSGDMQTSFTETSSRTGLLSWINRYPEIRLDLGERIKASLDVVSSSIKLGVKSRVLLLNKDGTVGLGNAPLDKVRFDEFPYASREAFRRAERLGTWMAKAGTTGSIFSAFGISP